MAILDLDGLPVVGGGGSSAGVTPGAGPWTAAPDVNRSDEKSLGAVTGIVKSTAGTPSAAVQADVTALLGAGAITPTMLADTAVTPGSYTNLTATIDADGRITAAANGTGGTGADLTTLGIYNVKDYGAAGDDSIVTTGGITNGLPTLVVASATGLIAGRYVTVVGAGAKVTTGSIDAAAVDPLDRCKLTVASTVGYQRDTWITVAGAGVAGATMYAKIIGVIGSVLHLSEDAATTVVAAAVTNDGVLRDAKILTAIGTTITLNKNATFTVAGAAVKIDDAPAFDAAILAMRTALGGTATGSNFTGGTIRVPPGAPNPTQAGQGQFFTRGYRTSRDVHLPCNVTIEGVNSFTDRSPSTVLTWDQGVEGFIWDGPSNRGRQTGGFGTGATIRKLALTSTCAVQSDPVSGDTVVASWKPATVYVAGDVRVPSTKRANDFGKAIKCLVGGTSRAGATNEPVWNSAGSNAGTYAEGGGSTVVWKMIDVNAAFFEATGKAEECFFFGWDGWACNNTASTPQAIGNLSKWVDCVVRTSQGGYYWHGNDANAGTATNCDATGVWVGFWDDSLLGNRRVNCHCGQAVRYGYNTARGNNVVCYMEQGSGLIYLTADSTWDDGVPGDGFNTGAKGGAWQAGHIYAAGDYVVPAVPTVPPRFFKTFSGGTSHATTEPVWAGVLGQTDSIADNSVTWYCFGDPTIVNAPTGQGIYQSQRVFYNPRTFGKGKGFFAATANSDEMFGWSDEQEAADYTITPLFSWRTDIHGLGWQGPDYGRAGAGSFVLSTARSVAAGTADFANQLRLPGVVKLGSQYTNECRFLGVLAAAPTVNPPWPGGYGENDWFIYANAVSGGWFGGTCTTPGTAGTFIFKNFGAIA